MSVRSHPPETAYGPMDNRVSGLSGGLPLSLEDDATRTLDVYGQHIVTLFI